MLISKEQIMQSNCSLITLVRYVGEGRDAPDLCILKLEKTAAELDFSRFRIKIEGYCDTPPRSGLK